MGESWILNAYWISLIIGIGYTIVSFILGGVSGHGHFDVGAGGDGMDGDLGDAGHGGGDSGAMVFGPFSPLVIAFFLTSFGATGIVLSTIKGMHIISLPLSVISGFVLAWLLIMLFNRFLGGMQSSSEVKIYTLIGVDAEITVAIPPNGIGEIAYVAMGARNVAPARSDSTIEIPRFSGVKISRIVGNMFFVELANANTTAPSTESYQP